VNYFIFEKLKKKSWANFQRIIELFTQKLSLSSQKYGFGIRDPEKTYSGSRIQGSKRHRIPDPDPNTCLRMYKNLHFEVGMWKNRSPVQASRIARELGFSNTASFGEGYHEWSEATK
jgi:hypothetical protein